MDLDILSLIEDNNYTLRGILITHDHLHHVRGLKTIMRIYETEIYAINPAIRGHRTTLVKDGELVNIGPFKTEVISIPGHSADSAVYKIDRLLFTGDTLSAGLLGSTASSYALATQANALRSKLLSLPGDYTVLPGHGPPSSLEAERRFNMDLNNLEQRKNRRPAFRAEF
jgi:glyoxylase-like metal-dependent hydrolase (beta-lactamase superfamily II)